MSRISRRGSLFILLTLISIVIFVLSSSGRLARIEGALRTVARPALTVFNGLGRQITNIFSTARDLRTLRSLNQQLKSQVDTLIIENARLQEVEIENRRLRELLRFTQLNPYYDFSSGQIIARVISREPTNYLAALTIDLGSDHGIKPGMPVVNEQGLVGRIHQVGPKSSTVLLITDPSSGVQARVKRENSRAVGVITGRAGVLPIMDYIPQDADVSVGDEVITSGLGGNFPKNLVIGQIIEVKKRDFNMFQQAVIRPTVNFDRLEFVLVITNFEPLPGQPVEPDSVG